MPGAFNQLITVTTAANFGYIHRYDFVGNDNQYCMHILVYIAGAVGRRFWTGVKVLALLFHLPSVILSPHLLV